VSAEQGSRRIDRVLADDYLADLGQRPLAEVRTLRTEAEQEEVDLSYIRRLVQGRLDIVRAELNRREGGQEGSIVDNLAHVLADEPRAGARGMGRHVTVEPSRVDSHRRYVEALVADVDLSNPAGHDDASLRRVLGELEAEEHKVSESRRQVQQVMDVLTAEVTRRYREGDADPSDLLPTEA